MNFLGGLSINGSCPWSAHANSTETTIDEKLRRRIRAVAIEGVFFVDLSIESHVGRVRGRCEATVCP